MNQAAHDSIIDFKGRQPVANIVVEGPLGIGKTTLTKRLAETFNYQALLEDVNHNPFLERFYQNQKNAALATQLFFLFQRAQQLNDQRQADIFKPVQVADFLMEKDRLFAKITLDKDEYALYEKVYEQLTVDEQQPDLVIYLQAPVNVLQERLQQRGLAHERQIDNGYLTKINEAYTEFFLYYDKSPLLIVNASELDIVNRPQDYLQLVDYILNIRNGRHYFNPSIA